MVVVIDPEVAAILPTPLEITPAAVPVLVAVLLASS